MTGIGFESRAVLSCTLAGRESSFERSKQVALSRGFLPAHCASRYRATKLGAVDEIPPRELSRLFAVLQQSGHIQRVPGLLSLFPVIAPAFFL